MHGNRTDIIFLEGWGSGVWKCKIKVILLTHLIRSVISFSLLLTSTPDILVVLCYLIAAQKSCFNTLKLVRSICCFLLRLKCEKKI